MIQAIPGGIGSQASQPPCKRCSELLQQDEVAEQCRDVESAHIREGHITEVAAFALGQLVDQSSGNARTDHQAAQVEAGSCL
jgi:hypothetical protein